jgi:hypothetical protein
MAAQNATVGETRAWLEAAYGVPHADDTHFVIVTNSSAGMTISGCCDGTDEAGTLLAVALRAVTGEARPSPESGSVIVSREDLAWALKFMSVDGAYTRAVKERLAEAAGVTP